MPGNLLTSVQNLCASSKRSLLSPAQAYASGYGAYGEALRLMWAGDHGEAAATVAAALAAEDVPAAQRCASYRLWIEALAEQQDKAGLKQLGQHLLRLGQEDAEVQASFAALRGIVHFECDELGAARLLGRAVQGDAITPYNLELVQLIESRSPDHIEPALARSPVPLTDYFHWQTLARGLLIGEHQAALARLQLTLREQCRDAVLPYLFDYHTRLDHGDFQGAGIAAAQLVELYPDTLDYAYFWAYALYEDKDYPQARQILQAVVKKHGDDDPEVSGLLGHTLAKLGDLKAATAWLKRSVALLKVAGLPTSHVSLQLADAEEEMRGEELDPALTIPRMTRKWLVNLSPRRYNELLTSPVASIDRLLRPMGPEPKSGDFCFFATTTKSDSQDHAQWRIVAIYTLDGDPIWHPTYGYHSALRLVTRLADGLPVDIQTQGEPTAKSPTQKSLRMRRRDQHISYGVYELDNYAIDIIEDAVRMNREDLIERRRGSESSRRPTA